MRKSVWLSWLGAVAFALFAGTAFAEDKTPPQTYAVIVGAGDFADPQIKPRPTATADATALYELFADKQYLGVAKENLHLLVSGKDVKAPAQPATKENILKALRDVAAKADKDDLVLVAMIGNGASAAEK